MKERPILFSAPMIQAILADRKSQTRRALKKQPPPWQGLHHCWFDAPIYGFTNENEPALNWWKIKCPYGRIGDRLWVREVWAPVSKDGRVMNRHDRFFLQSNPVQYMKEATHYVIYRADEPDEAKRIWRFGGTTEERWRTPIFMPRWASRITLEITDVRVQRLQEVSEEDCRAEGAIPIYPKYMYPDEPLSEWHYYRGFNKLWDSINGKTHPWSSNPFVWAISFRRVET